MIKKRILPVVMILAAFLLQTTVFQSIKLAGAVPNLLLVLTITYGYLRGRTSGLVIGFFFRLAARLPVWKRNWIICIYFYDNWFCCRLL